MMIWVDTETTGLNVTKDLLLEVAVVVTNDTFEVLTSLITTLFVPRLSQRLSHQKLDPVVRAMHTDNGLLALCQDPDRSIGKRHATQLLTDLLQPYGEPGTEPMFGNTVSFDRRFLENYMPAVAAWFHYRNVDVSSVKELARRRAPAVAAQWKKITESSGPKKHRAMDDILESIEELKFYSNCMETGTWF